MNSNPYDRLPEVPSFRVASHDLIDGGEIPPRHASPDSGGENVSPHLTWYGFPPETRSFVVTIFDADAPTPSGFWHWAVADIPVQVTSLPRGAGAPGSTGQAGAAVDRETTDRPGETPAEAPGLPPGAQPIRNDSGSAAYNGPAPPPGDDRHRYFIAVHAVDVDSLRLGDTVTPASLSFALLGHTLGRAVMMASYEAGASRHVA
jgi:Raf kinase inhibitor-like YbhB/YbcL family protein